MLAEMMKYKELLYFLVHKEVRIRYRNSLFGFFWTLLEPLGLMVIYTIVFGYILNVTEGRGEGIQHYSLFILSGLIPWTFFNNSMKKGTKSLSSNASLIKKVYFPREIFPVTMLLSNLVNFVPAFLLVFVVALSLGHPIDWGQLAMLPAFVLLQSVFTLACVFFVSVLNIYYRDVEFIINLVLRGWMYLSPIIYPVSFLSQNESDLVQQFADFYFLNPMAVMISLYHGIFYENQMVSPGFIIYTIVLSLVLLFSSWAIFKRLNRRVGEVI
ncbi:ABC transporter permease [Paludifilum halophilum]|uniref:Transport permease protein n=1 Tax=Paludifilum halophilum TaxID=1642702 RepID=A0A235B5G7_9BACL|nr:ABC transporter permease [Paludifilum halophilum]OYD07533.1 ABC transporter [Paludifilum halophilum]